MDIFTKKDVLEKAKNLNVKFIRLQFTDIFGVLKNIAITVEELERALNGELMFDSSVIEGFAMNKESDIYLVPDPSTFVVFPWRPREGAVARLICDVYSPNGEPFPGCPRSALKRVLKEAEDAGYKMMVGPEIEFFLFYTDEKGNPTTSSHDRAGYCDLSPVDLGENPRRDMVLTLEEMGFEIGSSHHELAPGQHEIELKYDGALSTADKIVTFKFVVRTIAQRHGLHASFMPKPLGNTAGSALHLYQFLFKEGHNCFYNPETKYNLSEEALYYIGGLLAHAPGYTALTNPLINSYKRLIPNDFAPVYVAWSEEHRNSIIRVPARRDDETGIEVRNPDPACNPYLALAVLLKSGLDGIKNKIVPPEPLLENAFKIDETKRKEMGIGTLPRNLEQALNALAGDKVVQEALGPHITKRLVDAKRQEIEKFESQVHSWEIQEYLTTY